MSGSTLEAMAKAVEESAVVLICVSKKYKESQVRQIAYSTLYKPFNPHFAFFQSFSRRVAQKQSILSNKEKRSSRSLWRAVSSRLDGWELSWALDSTLT